MLAFCSICVLLLTGVLFFFPLRSGALGKVFGGYGIVLISVGRLGMAYWVGGQIREAGLVRLGGFGLT